MPRKANATAKSFLSLSELVSWGITALKFLARQGRSVHLKPGAAPQDCGNAKMTSAEGAIHCQIGPG